MKNQYLISSIILSVVSCNVPHSSLIDIDDNQYQTKKYGETIWMIENLRTTHDKSGNNITYYYPNEDSSKSENFGLLYDFETACNVCPEGWQLPSNKDWEALFDLANQNIASKFKDIHYWEGEENTNESGFSAKPAGYGNNGEHDNNFNSKTILWSSSKEEHFIWTYILEKGKDSIRTASQHPTYAFSVRCIKK